MKTLKADALIDIPWKNGGGITRRIAKGVLRTREVWTLSRADVAVEGPFSDFTGMVRVLTVVTGGVMELESDAGNIVAAPWVPVRFDGGLQVKSWLRDGPITDLNLMFDPLACLGEVVTITGPVQQRVAGPARGLLVFHVLAGAPQVNAQHLAPGDTAFIDEGDAAIDLKDSDAVLKISLTYLDQSDAIRLCIADR